MAKAAGSKSKTKNGAKYADYDEIAFYIEECREAVARARRKEMAIDETLKVLADSSARVSRASIAAAPRPPSALDEREQSLRRLEAELVQRELELLEREIKMYIQQEELEKLRPLAGLHRVIRAMAKERKLDSLLEVLTLETQQMIRCDRCSVFVLDGGRGELWTKVAQGLPWESCIRVALNGNSIVSVCARTKEVINIANAYDDARFDGGIDRTTGYRTGSVLCVPMLNRKGEPLGVFQALNKVTGTFTDDDAEWLEGLAAVAAGLIEQAQAYAEIEYFVDKTLEMLAQTIDKRDPLTAGHSVRVTRYSVLIGESLGLPEADIDVLRYAAMMHDFGKIGVPEAILWKNGRLTAEEYAIVQTHAKITYDLLSTLPFTGRLKDVPFVASCHHEKLDGTGYYRALKGDQIPYLTRIITVADVFDALTSVRHYRNRMPISKVSEILEQGRDNHFDSRIVDAFLNLPCDQVVQVLESERGMDTTPDLDVFEKISFKRLVELCCGAGAQPLEIDLLQIFDKIYNAGLPADYQALD